METPFRKNECEDIDELHKIISELNKENWELRIENEQLRHGRFMRAVKKTGSAMLKLVFSPFGALIASARWLSSRTSDGLKTIALISFTAIFTIFTVSSMATSCEKWDARRDKALKEANDHVEEAARLWMQETGHTEGELHCNKLFRQEDIHPEGLVACEIRRVTEQTIQLGCFAVGEKLCYRY